MFIVYFFICVAALFGVMAGLRVMLRRRWGYPLMVASALVISTLVFFPFSMFLKIFMEP